jgi:hypothetical protein
MAVTKNPNNLTRFGVANFGAPITHYTIDAGASLANETNPGEAVEAIVAVISTKGTVVALGTELNGAFRVAVENSDWVAADLQTAIRALGATVGANDYDATGATVADFTY